MNKEEWEKYITWEERVTDKLERWVKYNKPITREQAEETIDFICEQDNVIDRKIRELDKYKNIIKLLKHFGENSLGIIYALKDNVEPTENEWLNLIEYEKYLRELKGDDK